MPVCELPEFFEKFLISDTVKLTLNCSKVTSQESPSFVHQCLVRFDMENCLFDENLRKDGISKKNVLVFTRLGLTLNFYKYGFWACPKSCRDSCLRTETLF